MANQRFGCEVDGVSISEYQVDFASQQAVERGVADEVRFHFRNMLDTGLETGSRQAVWTNETTMYVDLSTLFAEFARVLPVGGRYVCITGCSNDVTGLRSKAVSRIDEHYTAHPPAQRVLPGAGGQPHGPDHRGRPHHRDHPVLGAAGARLGRDRHRGPVPDRVKEGSFHYLMIVADRI